MRHAARIDDNQPLIVEALRRAGARVQPLHTVGKGCPDLLVGFRGRNLLLEIKDGAKSASRRELTRDERAWHDQWAGQVAVVASIAEALAAIGASDAAV